MTYYGMYVQQLALLDLVLSQEVLAPKPVFWARRASKGRRIASLSFFFTARQRKTMLNMLWRV